MTTAHVTSPRPALGDPVAWSFPAMAHRRVADDLDIHAVPLPGRGMAAVDLLLDAPVGAEDPDRAGTAVLTGWALDEGTEAHDADVFAMALDRLGASLSTEAGSGGTRISLDVPVGNLDPAVALLAEAVATATFPPVEVDRLVRQRIDQIRAQLARPEGRASVVARAEGIAASHRLSLPSGGVADTVERIDRDTVAEFHADHLCTGPATVVVAGDVDAAAVTGMLGEHLAAGRRGSRAPHQPRPLDHRPGSRVVVVDKPGAVQTQLILQRPGPDRRADDWSALRVAAHVLGGTLTSRLDIVLREELGYTYGTRTRLQTFRRGGLVQLLTGSVHTEATVDAVARASTIMREFAADGPTHDERAAAVDYLAGVRPLALETPRAITSEISRNLLDDLASDHTEQFLEGLLAVTTADAAAAAARHLDPGGLLLVAVGDAAAIADGLAGLGLGDVDVR